MELQDFHDRCVVEIKLTVVDDAIHRGISQTLSSEECFFIFVYAALLLFPNAAMSLKYGYCSFELTGNSVQNMAYIILFCALVLRF